MAFWRIQVSKGPAAEWEHYNPAIRPGEMIVVEKANGGVCIKMNKGVRDAPYSEVPTIWDEDVAAKLESDLAESQKAASDAENSKTAAQGYAQSAEAAAEKINEKKILGITDNITFAVDPKDMGLNVIVSTSDSEG